MKKYLTAKEVEELKQIVSNTKESGNQKVLSLMEFINELSETRYHPDTLEPVEKPEGLIKTFNDCTPQDISEIEQYEESLTLEQVFERYKEMNSCQCRCSCM